MGRFRRRIIPAVLGLLLVVGAAAPAGGQAGDAPQLRRTGEHVVDEHGRVVLLRGVNVVWKAPPFVPPDEPGGLTDVDLARIAGHGFDVIRLGVSFEGLMPAKGDIDEAYVEAVAAVVDRIAAHGLYALIDVHQDLMGKPWGNGFPQWAILHTPALEALEPDLGFPLNAARPSHNLAWDHFWRDGKMAPTDPKGVVGYLTDAIGALADRVGGHPALAGIEILNEAWAGTPVLTCAALPLGCPLVDAYVQRTWQRITERIRAADPDVLVWWEPASTWNLTAPSHLGHPPFTPAIADPQVGFAFHDYCAFGELSTYLGLPAALQQGCDLYHDLTWANAAVMRARTGLPQLVTEFGNIDDATELDRALRRSDAAFAGWQYWHYGAGFGLRPEGSTEPFTPTQRSRLVRTYPRATAGTPGPLSFDPDTGEMRYRYTARALAAPTEIAVSDEHYPDGYEVTVTGGTVTSATGAPVVTVEADDGAAVDVVVRRAATAGSGPAAVPSPAPDAATDAGAGAPNTAAGTARPLGSGPATGSGALPATGGTTGLGWPLAALALALAAGRLARRREPTPQEARGTARLG